jgi:hypothetical protein
MFAIRIAIPTMFADQVTKPIHGWVGGFYQLRRDPEPESPYIRKFRITNVAHDRSEAAEFSCYADAKRVADGIVGPGAGSCEIVKAGFPIERSAERLARMMDFLTLRGLENGRATRGHGGISFNGRYRAIVNRIAIEFDRKPLAERQPIYNAR